MGDHERHELESRHQTVIGPEARMEISAVEDHIVRAHFESFEGYGGSFHILEEGLEPFFAPGLDAAVCVDLKA